MGGDAPGVGGGGGGGGGLGNDAKGLTCAAPPEKAGGGSGNWRR